MLSAVDAPALLLGLAKIILDAQAVLSAAFRLLVN